MSDASAYSGSLLLRLRNLLLGTSLLALLSVGYFYITDTRASIHRWFVVPSLRFLYKDPEEAHHYGTQALKFLYQFGLYPRERGSPGQEGDLTIEVFGQTLANPIGTSAGIDKHADVPDPLFAIGPAIIELGGATPLPQDGNPKPRVFRLPSQNAIINRYGLNSEGADHMAMRLRQRVRQYANSLGLGHDADAERSVLDGEAGVPPGSLMPGRLMAVQIAKNKFTPEADVEAVEKDYVYCVERLAPYADILVVNVSSPNTPGLRTLQKTEPLTRILSGVVAAAKEIDRKSKPFVMVKVSPDEDSDEQVAGICEAVWESGVDGVIVGNTTKRRPDPLPSGFTLPPAEEKALSEMGGYSGPQLFERTVKLVQKYRRLLDTPTPKKSEFNPESARKQDTAPVAKNSQPSSSSSERSTTSIIAEPETSAEKATAAIIGGPEDARQADKEVLDVTEKDRLPEGGKQPLFRIPERKHETLKVISEAVEEMPPKAQDPKPTPSDRPKVIFATGGVTNGKQALELLNAGASVAMVYTALVYGGVGTISRIKDEMREELRKGKQQKS